MYSQLHPVSNNSFRASLCVDCLLTASPFTEYLGKERTTTAYQLLNAITYGPYNRHWSSEFFNSDANHISITEISTPVQLKSQANQVFPRKKAMDVEQDLKALKIGLLEDEFDILDALHHMGFDSEQSFSAVKKVRESDEKCTLEAVLKIITEGDQESPRSIVCKYPAITFSY